MDKAGGLPGGSRLLNIQFLLSPEGWFAELGLYMLHLSAGGHHYPTSSSQGGKGAVGVHGPIGMMVSVNITCKTD